MNPADVLALSFIALAFAAWGVYLYRLKKETREIERETARRRRRNRS